MPEYSWREKILLCFSFIITKAEKLRTAKFSAIYQFLKILANDFKDEYNVPLS